MDGARKLIVSGRLEPILFYVQRFIIHAHHPLETLQQDLGAAGKLLQFLQVQRAWLLPIHHVCHQAGFAWWYVRYARHDSELQRLEAEAKAAKRGLWAEKDPMPPWEFRKAKMLRRQ